MDRPAEPTEVPIGSFPTEPTPAQSESFARTNNRLKVSDYLHRTIHHGAAAASQCEWTTHIGADLVTEEVGALAWVLIDTIMEARFGPATPLYFKWREHTLAGKKIPPPYDSAIAAFAEPVFGLPHAMKSEEHLYGHVGEWLWHLLTKDSPSVRVQLPPKGSVTDSGGDGFSIYETSTGELRFRLWESKKNTGKGSLSTSLNRAYEQLAIDGPKYVAMIVGTFESGSSGTADDVLALVSELPMAWIQGYQITGAGVMLATHQTIPDTPFKNMAAALPQFDKPGQLRGLAASSDRYVEMAMMARRYAWTAL